MSVGSYSNIRPSDVSPADVEIFYYYVSGRTSSAPVTLKKLTSTTILTPVYHNQNTTDVTSAQNVELLGGMYNLKLESADFSELGIYNLYLRPKQIRTQISDCGVLSSLPSVRGLVIDLSTVSSEDVNKFTPQGLVGYRIEYLGDDNTKTPNFFRIIASSFYCEPISSNLSNSTQKAIRYRYSDTPTNLMFLTVTPSSAPTTRPNVVPFIGQPNQKIIITNTYFNPVTIEIEMVQYDDTTLGYALYGNQTKAMTSGIYTIYDNNNNIYKQYNLYEIKDEFNATLYEVREQRTDIDNTLDFSTITG